MKKIIKKKIVVSRPIGISDMKVETCCEPDFQRIEAVKLISEITEPFSNGELNIVKEKVNEIIRTINK